MLVDSMNRPFQITIFTITLLTILSLAPQLGHLGNRYSTREQPRLVERTEQCWSIQNVTTIQNATRVIDGGIVIENGGFLAILDSIVYLTDSSSAVTSIEVRAGGVLNITRSSVYSGNDTAWRLRAAKGSQLSVTYSILQNNGVGDTALVSIETDYAILNGNSISGAGGDGIHIEGCESVIISNNVINACAWEGIDVLNAERCIITKNTIYNVGYGGVTCSSSQDLLIAQNTVLNCTYNGVLVGHSQGVEVVANCLQDAGHRGICIEFSSNIFVTENSIHRCDQTGIDVQSCRNAIIHRNFIDSPNLYGISVFDESTMIQAVCNNITKSRGHGVLVDVCTDLIVGWNIILEPDQDGVHVDRSDDNITLVGNIIDHCGENGIHVQRSSYVSISGNLLNRSWLENFYCYESYHVIFFLNAISHLWNGVARLPSSSVTFDNGTHGNYWSLYTGQDVDSDNIGDTPYTFYRNIQDEYPIMSIETVEEYRLSRLVSMIWYESITTPVTTTTPDSTDMTLEFLLIMNIPIQMLAVVLILTEIRARTK